MSMGAGDGRGGEHDGGPDDGLGAGRAAASGGARGADDAALLALARGRGQAAADLRARLKAALRAAHAGPNAADLASAPTLGDWRVALYPGRKAICLQGRVEGHPELDGPRILTSPLIALRAGRRLGQARTLSRWYWVNMQSFRPEDPARRADELRGLQRILAAQRARLEAALRDEEEREGEG